MECFNLQITNLLNSPSIRRIHFIGIGGISMSALAEVLVSQGYIVSGSDLKMSSITTKLEGIGIKIFSGHNANNIQNPDMAVYTAAVKEDNPELIQARKSGVPVIERATLLGLLMKKYDYNISVSGTHGKTTTTSMVTMIMVESGLDPTIHIGGELDAIGGNTKIGGNKYFITEACEYVESFLKFYPFIAVILNIEADHLDYFRDLEHVKEAFYKFASLVPEDGCIVACADDANTMSVLEKVGRRKVTYGINAPDADWSAKNISFNDQGCAAYKLYHGGEEVCDIILSVPGIHNVGNSLAAIAACNLLGCSMEAISRGLFSFHGTHRRFEHKGIAGGIRVIDDYAHHPTEVKATLSAAKNAAAGRIWCVFQPHTYTRTKALLEDFTRSFGDADEVIVTDIYAAREKDTGDIHARTLSSRLKANGVRSEYIQSFEAIADYIGKHAEAGDMVITMGAGDVYKIGELLLKK